MLQQAPGKAFWAGAYNYAFTLFFMNTAVYSFWKLKIQMLPPLMDNVGQPNKAQ